jgi:hypothetical protein
MDTVFRSVGKLFALSPDISVAVVDAESNSSSTVNKICTPELFS